MSAFFRRIASVLIFLLILNLGFAGSYVISEKFLKAHDYIVLFQKEEALKIIIPETNTSRPENLLMVHLESVLAFMEAFLYETAVTRSAYEKRFAGWEDKLETGDSKSPYYRYCLAHLYMQRGLLSMKHMEYVRSGLDIRKSIKMFQENGRLFPSFFIQYKELGLINCMLGTVPEQFEWLLGLAGMSGSLKLGEKQLKQLFDISTSRKEFSFLQAEALLYNCAAVTILYNDASKANAFIMRLPEIDLKYRASPLYIFSVSSLYAHAGKNSEALKILSSYQKKEKVLRFDYLDYFRGLVLLQQGNVQAKTYFSRFLLNFEGLHYVKSAYHKLAWCYALEDNMEQYKTYMSLALNAGRALNDADKQALAEAQSGHIPHSGLLKARLLSDGGYFEKALEVIEQIDSSDICSDHEYCVEFLYRKARIYDLMGKENLAIPIYKAVIDIGKNDQSYFAANSALMLGQIFENNGDYSTAEKWYAMCLTLPFTEYKNSIQQKAKAGLRRIGK